MKYFEKVLIFSFFGVPLLLVLLPLSFVLVFDTFYSKTPSLALEELSETFKKRRIAYEKLETMFSEDIFLTFKFPVIGDSIVSFYRKKDPERVGEPWYYAGHNDEKIASSKEQHLTEEEMLERTSLASERYKYYLRLLDKTGCSRIELHSGRRRYVLKKDRWGLKGVKGRFYIMRGSPSFIKSERKIWLKNYWHLTGDIYLVHYFENFNLGSSFR